MNEDEKTILKREMDWIQRFYRIVKSDEKFYQAFKKSYPMLAEFLEREQYALIIKNWPKVRKIFLKVLKQQNEYHHWDDFNFISNLELKEKLYGAQLK